MTATTRLGVDAVNSIVAAQCARLDSGYVRIYTGDPPTAGADGSITTQQLIAEFRFASTAFGTPVDGEAIANTLTTTTCIIDYTVDGSNHAWCRLLASNGSTVEMDGTVGNSSANLIIDLTPLVFTQNQPIQITLLTITCPMG